MLTQTIDWWVVGEYTRVMRKDPPCGRMRVRTHRGSSPRCKEMYLYESLTFNGTSWFYMGPSRLIPLTSGSTAE